MILHVAKFLQEEQDEKNDMARRMSNLVELQKIREQQVENSIIHQKNIKEAFNKNERMDSFQVGDWVLKWDALKEKKSNHDKFDAIWKRSFVIAQV